MRIITVRPTAVLIEEKKLLLVHSPSVGESAPGMREWSLPGGTLEAGETLAACLVREVQEETGLAVAVERLLYVCDRIADGQHVVHITFLVRRQGDDTIRPNGAARMVPFAELPEYGFGERFRELAHAGFPGNGGYLGSVESIGL